MYSTLGIFTKVRVSADVLDDKNAATKEQIKALMFWFKVRICGNFCKVDLSTCDNLVSARMKMNMFLMMMMRVMMMIAAVMQR